MKIAALGRLQVEFQDNSDGLFRDVQLPLVVALLLEAARRCGIAPRFAAKPAKHN